MINIPLLQPVPIYTATQLNKMPYMQMMAAIDAQEKFALVENKMGGVAVSIKRNMEQGKKLYQVVERNQTRYFIGTEYEYATGDVEYVPPRIMRQLESRGFVSLPDAPVKEAS